MSSVCLVTFFYCSYTVGYVIRGSVMVLLDRTLASSYRLPIVTISLFAAVWPQFATQCCHLLSHLCSWKQFLAYLTNLLIPI